MDWKLSLGEEHLVCWQMSYEMGSFMTALWDAMAKADGDNFIRLAKAFPDDVMALKRYRYEAGYWDGVIARWKARFTVSNESSQ